MKKIDLERYSRQIELNEVGAEGQQRLSQAAVAVVGAGGLGSSILPILAGADIGRIRIIDNDKVSLSNLPRQTLYEERDLGSPKAELAAAYLAKRNADCQLEALALRLDSNNAKDLLQDVDLIIDACDNLETRIAIDRAAQTLQKPWIYTSIEGWQGQLTVFSGKGGKWGSYQELFGDSETVMPSGIFGYNEMVVQSDLFDSIIPVMGSTAATLGSLAASEALKYLLGIKSRLTHELLLIDTLKLDWQLLER